MWKIRDFRCSRCVDEPDFEAMTSDEEAPPCPKCNDSEFVTRGGPTATAGYKINGNNSASTSPKGTGSFKRK